MDSNNPMIIKQFNKWLAQQNPSKPLIDFFHLGGQGASLQLLDLMSDTVSDMKLKSYRVLDLGCGIGGTARLIAQRVAHVNGVDLNTEYCQIAYQLNKLYHTQNVTFTQANALQLPFVDSSFDLVISEHLQMAIADKIQYVKEIARVLRPGGFVLCFELFKTQHCQNHLIDLPLPWADDQSTQHLDLASTLETKLKKMYLYPLKKHDVSTLCLEQLTKKLHYQTVTGSDILMSGNALKKQENLLKLLKNGWISCQQWLLTKSHCL